MYRFNNDNIITGYIKQLLHSFNLPRCKVFNNITELLNYFPSGCSGFGIVKKYQNNHDCIVYLTRDRQSQLVAFYSFNKKYENLTTNFSLFNGVYDTACHKYLGDYLRFIRDYRGINLMSMYNCFSNEILIGNEYKYIIVPVKQKQDYTIAFTGTKYAYAFTYRDTLDDIEKLFNGSEQDDYSTIVSRVSSNFSSPFTVNSGIGKESEVINTGPRPGRTKYTIFNEKYYKLVIRVKISQPDIITVLEGDYSHINQAFTPIQANFDNELEDNTYTNVDIDKYLSDFQLLDYHLGNSNVNYPYADRLLEYLTDMVILPNDKISKNIIDAKYKVLTRYDGKTKSNVGYVNSSFTNIDRLRFLDAFYQTKYGYTKTYDLLGYVDKEIEQCLDDERLNPEGGE